MVGIRKNEIAYWYFGVPFAARTIGRELVCWHTTHGVGVNTFSFRYFPKVKSKGIPTT